MVKIYQHIESLQFALNHSSSDISHTYSSFSFDTYSTIDHFITTDSLFHAIQSYTTCDDIVNQSDHLPLFLSIDIELSRSVTPGINPQCTARIPRQQWDRADITDCFIYQTTLDNDLSSLQLPRDCINCNDYYYYYISLFTQNMV